MRIAVLILGLILGGLMFMHTAMLGSLAGAAAGAGATQAKAITWSGFAGVIMALIWLVAVALVFPVPIVSVVLFVFAGIIGFAASANFPDIAIWAVVSLALAVFSFFAWIGKRKNDRVDRQRDAMLQQALAGRSLTH